MVAAVEIILIYFSAKPGILTCHFLSQKFFCSQDFYFLYPIKCPIAVGNNLFIINYN